MISPAKRLGLENLGSVSSWKSAGNGESVSEFGSESYLVPVSNVDADCLSRNFAFRIFSQQVKLHTRYRLFHQTDCLPHTAIEEYFCLVKSYARQDRSARRQAGKLPRNGRSDPAFSRLNCRSSPSTLDNLAAGATEHNPTLLSNSHLADGTAHHRGRPRRSPFLWNGSERTQSPTAQIHGSHPLASWLFHDVSQSEIDACVTEYHIREYQQNLPPTSPYGEPATSRPSSSFSARRLSSPLHIADQSPRRLRYLCIWRQQPGFLGCRIEDAG